MFTLPLAVTGWSTGASGSVAMNAGKISMRIVVVPVVLLLGAACGDSPSRPPEPLALAVVPEQEVLFPGDTFTFRVEGVREDGTRAPAPRGTTWTTGNPQIATVDAATGRVTAVANGTTLVVASASGAVQQGGAVTVQADAFQRCERQLVLLGSDSSGQLATGDCAMSHGTLYDIWEFRLSQPRSVTITMRSTAVQPYFALHNRVGTSLAHGGMISTATGSATLSVALQPGRYALLAYASSVAKTGTYTLSIQ